MLIGYASSKMSFNVSIILLYVLHVRFYIAYSAVMQLSLKGIVEIIYWLMYNVYTVTLYLQFDAYLYTVID